MMHLLLYLYYKFILTADCLEEDIACMFSEKHASEGIFM